MSTISDNYPISVLAAALIHLRRGNPHMAEEILTSALEESRQLNEEPHIDISLAANYLQLGYPKQALEVIERVLT